MELAIPDRYPKLIVVAFIVLLAGPEILAAHAGPKLHYHQERIEWQAVFGLALVRTLPCRSFATRHADLAVNPACGSSQKMRIKRMNMIFVVVVALAMIGAVLYHQTSTAQDSADGAVLDQLRAAGSDLSKPHRLEFYLYVPSEEAASRVASALSREGFQVDVPTAAIGPGWLALASKTLVPSSQALTRIRQLLSKLASVEGGEYDGWEAQVTR